MENILIISRGKVKAEIVIRTKTTHGLVSETRHLLLGSTGWTDAKGNKYNLD